MGVVRTCAQDDCKWKGEGEGWRPPGSEKGVFVTLTRTFSHALTHPHPFTHLTPLTPPSARAHRSIMQQAVGMAMTDRARAATSRILSCTSLSRHGEKKKETQRRNILGPSCPRPQVPEYHLQETREEKTEGEKTDHIKKMHIKHTHAHRQRGGGKAEFRFKTVPFFSWDGWVSGVGAAAGVIGFFVITD